jgi:hypothetical protein
MKKITQQYEIYQQSVFLYRFNFVFAVIAVGFSGYTMYFSIYDIVGKEPLQSLIITFVWSLAVDVLPIFALKRFVDLVVQGKGNWSFYAKMTLSVVIILSFVSLGTSIRGGYVQIVLNEMPKKEIDFEGIQQAQKNLFSVASEKFEVKNYDSEISQLKTEKNRLLGTAANFENWQVGGTLKRRAAKKATEIESEIKRLSKLNESVLQTARQMSNQKTKQVEVLAASQTTIQNQILANVQEANSEREANIWVKFVSYAVFICIIWSVALFVTVLAAKADADSKIDAKNADLETSEHDIDLFLSKAKKLKNENPKLTNAEIYRTIKAYFEDEGYKVPFAASTFYQKIKS